MLLWSFCRKRVNLHQIWWECWDWRCHTRTKRVWNSLAGRGGQLLKAGSTAAWEGKEGHRPEVSIMARGRGKGVRFLYVVSCLHQKREHLGFLISFPRCQRRLKNCQRSHIKSYSQTLHYRYIQTFQNSPYIAQGKEFFNLLHAAYTVIFRNLHLFWRRKWQPTPTFLPRESHGQRSLMSYSSRGRKESDLT